MNLKQARELQNLSQMDLSRKTGIPQTALSLQESGSKDMDLEDMAALDATFGLSLDWPDPILPQSKIIVLQALMTLAERFPLITVLEFARKTLTDRRDRTPVKKIVFYAKAIGKGSGDILPPAGMKG